MNGKTQEKEIKQASFSSVITIDDRLFVQSRLSPPINVLKLRIPVRMVAALERLAVGLETVAQIMEESIDRPLTDRMPLRLECRRQVGRALASPSEQRHRVATGHRIDQSFQGLYEVWITRPQWLASPSRAA